MKNVLKILASFILSIVLVMLNLLSIIIMCISHLLYGGCKKILFWLIWQEEVKYINNLECIILIISSTLFSMFILYMFTTRTMLTTCSPKRNLICSKWQKDGF